MNELLLSIILIFILFSSLLGIKELSKKKFCVICVSVSLSWLTLLTMYHLKIFQDGLIVALLMGQSITGIYYLVEKHTAETLKIFRLPFLLTLFFIFYTGLSLNFEIKSILLLSIIWAIFIALFLTKKNPSVKAMVDRVIACCKDW